MNDKFVIKMLIGFQKVDKQFIPVESYNLSKNVISNFIMATVSGFEDVSL
jgi:hypothetical protein